MRGAAGPPLLTPDCRHSEAGDHSDRQLWADVGPLARVDGLTAAGGGTDSPLSQWVAMGAFALLPANCQSSLAPVSASAACLSLFPPLMAD
jgi:hypothetical protein